MHSSRCRRLVPRLVPRWLAHRLTRCRGRSLRSQPAGCAAPNHCEYRSWAPFCGLFCRQLCSSLVACDVPPRVAVRFRQHAMAYLVGLSTAHAVCRTLQRLPQHRREMSRYELARTPHATGPHRFHTSFERRVFHQHGRDILLAQGKQLQDRLRSHSAHSIRLE